jgi:hypothetical protein
MTPTILEESVIEADVTCNIVVIVSGSLFSEA